MTSLPPAPVYARRIRFDEIDAAGVMYFARIMHLAHEAIEHAYWTLGWPISRQFSELDVGMPILETHASFRRPLRLDDEVQVVVLRNSMSEKTVELTVQVWLGEAVAAVIDLTLCCVTRGFQSTPLPDSLRLVFAALKQAPRSP